MYEPNRVNIISIVYIFIVCNLFMHNKYKHLMTRDIIIFKHNNK